MHRDTLPQQRDGIAPPSPRGQRNPHPPQSVRPSLPKSGVCGKRMSNRNRRAIAAALKAQLPVTPMERAPSMPAPYQTPSGFVRGIPNRFVEEPQGAGGTMRNRKGYFPNYERMTDPHDKQYNPAP